MSFLRNNTRPLPATLSGILLIFGLCWFTAHAIEQLNLSVHKLTNKTWSIEGLQFELDWRSSQTTAYRLQIDTLRLRQLKQPLHDLSIHCLQGEVTDQRISCDKGTLHVPHPKLNNPNLEISFTFDQTTGELHCQLDNLQIAKGRAHVHLKKDGPTWQVAVDARKLALGSLAKLLPPDQRPLQDWQYQGLIDVNLQLAMREQGLTSLRWTSNVSEVSLSDGLAEIMGEGLRARVRGKLTPVSKGWQIDTSLSLNQGELLTPYFYLNPATHPLEMDLALSTDKPLQQLRIKSLQLVQQQLLQINMQGELNLAAEQPVKKLQITVAPFQLADIYRELLQPVLFGTPWDRFELAGQSDLRLDISPQQKNLQVTLTDVQLDDMETQETSRRLGLYDINGQLHWSQGAESQPSWLEWQAGHLLETIDVGSSRLDFSLADKRFHLLRQTTLPVLDGSLVMDRLDINALGQTNQKLQFDGIITPISMSALSHALGWIPLSGKLSGMIPGLTYENGVFDIEGVLLVRMFDGDILIKGLRVRDLFGIYPQLSADIEIHGLDLETLTNTFSFGRITGRLDGYIRNLSLEEWQPVRFDARFYTPDNDKSRRRISQKAVDNISNLGGVGMSGALARSFLGFFEEFHYKRIGIGCLLRNGTCEMVGVGEAKQGYYLVEGSGLPRIDIIGYNRTADWDRLLQQLKQIAASGTPVIE